MRWPFSGARAPVRAEAEGADATEIAVAALEREARGQVPEPGALAVAEACAGLWERAIGSATVGPASLALAPVTAPMLALVGRQLAATGNSLWAIDVGEGGVTLAPASHWDPGAGANPLAWRYRLTMAYPRGVVTRDLARGAVLHFAIGATAGEPWRGRSPLRRARTTGDLAARIERAMAKEADLAPSRLVYATLTDQGLKDSLESTLKDGGTSVLPSPTVAGMGQPDRLLSGPTSIGPKPEAAFEALRSHVGQDICAAFGVPPTLWNPTGDGAGQREAWRRFWLGCIAPLGRLIEAELRAKLDPAAMVGFAALAAADEDARSRAVARRAQAYKTYREAGMDDAEARRHAGLE